MIKLMLKFLRINRYKFYILLLSLLILTINLINLLTNYMNEKVNNNVINTVKNKMMYVASNDESDKFNSLKSLKNVDGIYYNEDAFYIETEKYGICKLKYFNPSIGLKKYKGIVSGINKNDVIIPKSFLQENNIKLQDILHKKIRLRKDNELIELYVVGIYNNTDDDCLYISSNNVSNEFKKNKKKYALLLSDEKMYKVVEKQLKNYDCYIDYVDDSLKSEKETYKDIDNILNIFFLICYILLLMIFLILIFSNIVDNKYNIALLKVFGLNDTRISLFLLLNFIIIFLISFLLSSVGIIIANRLMIFIFKIKTFLKIYLLIRNLSLMILIIVSIVIISQLKLKNINIINLLKEKM